MVHELEKTPKRPKEDRSKGIRQIGIRAACEPGRTSSLTQEELDQLLLEVIIESKLPFQILNRPKFKKLIKRLAAGRNIISRRVARGRIPILYHSTKTKLMAKLVKAKRVGTTADAWKSRGKGYLGVTAHWLDPDSLERRSAALACRRVKGSLTYDVLATLLSDIFQEYGIQDKVSCTVTDNGSNFLKAFRQFTVDDDGDEGEDEESDADDATEMDTAEQAVDEPVLYMVGDLFDAGEGAGDVSLPPHRRCACHLLNLVATVDLDKDLERPGPVKTAWANVLSKCRAFWSKQKRSTVAQDVVKTQLGRVLPVPNATRWNSTYDAMKEIVRNYDGDRRAAITAVCQTLKVDPLTVREVEFLQEYVKMMEPLAHTLDLLQEDKFVSAGYLLPAIHNLLARYRSMDELRYCQPLVETLMKAIRTRFSDYLWDKDLVIAACLVPMFRLDWIRGTVEGPEKVHEARDWLEEAMADLASRNEAVFCLHTGLARLSEGQLKS
ncbi:Putative AC9 transposase [Frankliniella fusca]|uniref:AC9 transposase n=1 Tax=Frankliniella fusca TaxID=407009 RepID=A0AAE1LN87_9NEOP|nr:Putative AC9 transposase [Frankliniella fusca]